MSQSESRLLKRKRLSLAAVATAALMVAASCSVEASASPGAVASRSVGKQLIEYLSEDAALRRIGAYCRSSWKNARIDRDLWDDCSQDVFARLYANLSAEEIVRAITERDSTERRELNRAIWATAQRQRREQRLQTLPHDDFTLDESDHWPKLNEELKSVFSAAEASEARLSPTQRSIIRQLGIGASVQEIATELNLPTPRVSDEKYKAIQKLREFFAET